MNVPIIVLINFLNQKRLFREKILLKVVSFISKIDVIGSIIRIKKACQSI